MKRMILYVDDQEVLAQLSCDILRSHGYGAETAHSGREALEKFKQKKFDILVTDFQMGNMNGLELARLVRMEIPGLPVLIVSGSPRSEGSSDVKLVHTGWDVHWRTEQYSSGHPFLSEDAAQFLADSKVALVGIDSFNIDSTEDGRRPVHSILLVANIPIVEQPVRTRSVTRQRIHILRRTSQSRAVR